MPLDRSDAGRDKYVPGSRRRLVITPTGETIPRAQSENNFATRHGFPSNYIFRQYSRDVSDSAQFKRGLRRAKERGIDPVEFRARAAAVSYQYENGILDKSPDGALADYLAMTGDRIGREYENQIWVGES